MDPVVNTQNSASHSGTILRGILNALGVIVLLNPIWHDVYLFIYGTPFNLKNVEMFSFPTDFFQTSKQYDLWYIYHALPYLVFGVALLVSYFAKKTRVTSTVNTILLVLVLLYGFFNTVFSIS
jgi:hypothetical protein